MTGQLEAARGEVTDEQPRTRSLIWHGAAIALPPELPASWMFDVVEAQVGDDQTRLLRAVYELIGKDQWGVVRDAAVREHVSPDGFLDLLEQVLGLYGMTGEGPLASAGSSANGSG
jgi:hypothetical protein